MPNACCASVSVPGCGFLKLKKLSLDCAHPGHEPVEFTEELSFVLLGLFDQIGGGAVANSLEGIGQLPIQKPHMLLQIQELLVKLVLLEHGRDLARERTGLSLSYSRVAGSSNAKNWLSGILSTAKLKRSPALIVLS
jgi:hypothetical protein